MSFSKVHNIGFYRPTPKSICCLSYESVRKRIALSRSDASIEIWNIINCPFIERTIPGDPEGSIEALCWYGQRLFSAGLTGHITEWDLFTLSSKYNVPVTSEAAWCMDIFPAKAKLAVGTEVGYINIFTIEEDNIVYEKLLDKQEGRILCIKFNSTGTILVSGGLDSVRIWNIETGHAIHKMTPGRSETNKPTIVWCLTIIEDTTIVSGDSRGKITFWDGKNGSFMESFQSHRADVLSIASSDDEHSLYCAGVDPVIISFVKIKVKGDTSRWVKSIQRKLHDHDVRCLTMCDSNRLYSAGVDGYLTYSSYPPKTLVKYPPIAQSPVVGVCGESKTLLLRYQTHLEVWRLGEAIDGSDVGSGDVKGGAMSITKPPEKLLVLQSKGEQYIACAAMSDNGKWIVYSTATSLRIYQLNLDVNETPEIIKISDIPPECSACVRVAFTPRSNVVLATKTGNIVYAALNAKLNGVKILQEIDTTKVLKDTIHLLHVSPCGEFLVAADPTSCVYVWSLKKDGQWQEHGAIPRYQCPPTALAIQHKPSQLVIVYSDRKVIEYTLRLHKFTEFSTELLDRHPRQWLSRAWPILGVTHDPRAKHVIILHDDSAVCVIDKNKKLPASDSKIPRIESSSLSDSVDSLSTSAQKDYTESHSFHIIKKYKHLVHLSWLKGDELVAVEVNPISLTEQLPPCLDLKQFGTK